MTAVYVKSLVSRTSLGDSGQELAKRLKTPDPDLLALPPMLEPRARTSGERV